MEIEFKNLKINILEPKNNFEKKVIFFLEEWLDEGEKVKVQTSGSTGTPKIFEIEKKRMLHSAKMTCDFLGLKEGNTALLCLPVEYISGKMMVVRSFERKLNLIISEPTIQPLQNLNQEIDFCAMTPLQVENSLDKLHWIKNIIIGGAAVSESLKKKIHETLKGKNSVVYETYGMSETLSHIALRQVFPQQDLSFKIFKGVGVSLDERGCLVIDAPALNPEKLITNDLVELFNSNEFRYLGRIDNVINSGGAKIFPEQLEALVKKEIPNEVIFLGLKDEVLGQKLVLVIEGEENEFIRQQIDSIPFEKKFHKPKEIYFIKEIPRTPNGKVSRKELLKIII